MSVGTPDGYNFAGTSRGARATEGIMGGWTKVWLSLLLVGVVSYPVQAQTPPTTQYRLTRTSPAPVQSFVFPRTSLTCGLTKGAPPSTGLRIDDPVNALLDCQLLGTANGVIVAAPASTYTIAAGADNGEWSGETPMTNIVPPANPGGGRVRPGAGAQVSAEGTAGERFAFGGLEIVPIRLDGINAVIYLGAPSLSVPGGYAVRAADRFAFSFWR